jgi:hypothetical protein
LLSWSLKTDANVSPVSFQPSLLGRTRLVPIDNVDKLPGISIELELELPIFINN